MKKKYFTEEEKKKGAAERTKRYYSTDKGKKTKKKYDQKYRQENKEELSNYRNKRRNTKAGYIDRFVERVKVSTPNTDLDRDYITSVMGDSCCITGKEFCYSNPYESFHNPLAPSIDRIDSGKGYYKGNIQIILACINRFKNDLPNDDFLDLWKALTNNSSKDT